MIKKYFLATLIPIFLSSCDQKNDQAKAMAELQAQLEEIQREREKTDDSEIVETGKKEGGEESSELEIENKVLRGSVDRSRKELEDSKKKNEELEKKIEDLQKEFDAYREKYITKVRANAEGEKIAELKIPSGKIYKNVEISEITDLRIKLRHSGGAASLNVNTAPPEWVEKYGLISGENISIGESQPIAVEKDGKSSGKPSDAVVIITGDDSVGTGFFVEDLGVYYLYTAAHVLSGNGKLKISTSNGREYRRFGRLEAAEGEDLVRLAMMEIPTHALALPKEGVVKNEDVIVAYGNSGGGGVVNEAEGEVKGVGASSFEVSAEVIQGNSGGPIVSEDGIQALGVVTHGIAARQDVWSKSTRFGEVRRFAARLDRRITWRKTTLDDFLKEPEAIAEMDQVTRLIFALSMLSPSKSGLRLSTRVGGESTALDIFQENKNMRAVQNLLKMNTELGSRKIGLSIADLKKEFSSYYREILSGSQTQTNRFNQISMTSYHRASAKQSLEWRAKANTALAARIASMK